MEERSGDGAASAAHAQGDECKGRRGAVWVELDLEGRRTLRWVPVGDVLAV